MPSNVQAPILEKLNQFETDAPHSLDEVSKALEDLKPALSKKTPIATPPPPSQKAPYTTPTQVAKPTKKRSKNRERVFLFIPLKSWKQN
jgi:glutaredoxin domain-containing cysteine-rich protein 1